MKHPILLNRVLLRLAFSTLAFCIQVLLIDPTLIFAQCNQFEDSTSNWYYYNVPPGGLYPESPAACNLITTPGFGSANSLFVVDRPGSTFIYNTTDFQRDYSQYYGRCLCFDIMLLNNNATVKPSIFFVTGWDPTQPRVWGTNPQAAVRFTASYDLPVDSAWVNICVSFDQCSGGLPPDNVDGSWEIIGGGDCSTFDQVMTNVEGIMFAVDMSGWPGTERFHLDNICIQECPSRIIPETDCCDEVGKIVKCCQSVETRISYLQECCLSTHTRLDDIQADLEWIKKALKVKPIKPFPARED